MDIDQYGQVGTCSDGGSIQCALQCDAIYLSENEILFGKLQSVPLAGVAEQQRLSAMARLCINRQRAIEPSECDVDYHLNRRFPLSVVILANGQAVQSRFVFSPLMAEAVNGCSRPSANDQ